MTLDVSNSTAPGADFPAASRRAAGPVAVRALLAMLLLALVVPAAGAAEPESLRIHAYSLEHRPVSEALTLIRPLLSPRGTVEEQARGNTLIVRDTSRVLSRVRKTIAAFDVPPKDLRLQIQVVHAGPEVQSVISPPLPSAGAELPPGLESRLKGLLRYEAYRVLAQADVPSKEGQPVSYSLGDDYEVSFRLGQVVGDQRLKLEDFRIAKRPLSTNKGRQLKPRELYHATFNLWLDKPFMLVLTQDPSRQEALLIAISARHGEEPSADD